MVYKKEKRNLMKKKKAVPVKKDIPVDEEELEKLQRESDKNAQALILQEAEKLKEKVKKHKPKATEKLKDKLKVRKIKSKRRRSRKLKAKAA